MELKDFVSESLKQIIKGIKSAQDFAQKEGRGAKIGPRGIAVLARDSQGQRPPHESKPRLPLERVEFDVAVTASETPDKSGGVGTRLRVVDVGAQAGKTTENIKVSRIRFSVPIVLPDLDAKEATN